MRAILSLLKCLSCGREEYLDFASGNCFYCCGQRMHKETVRP